MLVVIQLKPLNFEKLMSILDVYFKVMNVHTNVLSKNKDRKLEGLNLYFIDLNKRSIIFD